MIRTKFTNIPMALIAASILTLATTGTRAHTRTEPFYLGVDISFVGSQGEASRQNLLDLLKEHGINAVRLRTFVDPTERDGYVPTERLSLYDEMYKDYGLEAITVGMNPSKTTLKVDSQGHLQMFRAGQGALFGISDPNRTGILRDPLGRFLKTKKPEIQRNNSTSSKKRVSL